MRTPTKLFLTIGLLAVSAHGAAVSFVLNPNDGLLAGAAGTSVGWGFTISTDSDYVTIQSIVFGDSTPVGIFWTPGLPSSTASNGSLSSTLGS